MRRHFTAVHWTSQVPLVLFYGLWCMVSMRPGGCMDYAGLRDQAR